MNISSELHYGNRKDPLFMEYNRRKGHFSMAAEHLHGHYELYYLFGGKRLYFIKNQSYTIQPGDLVLIPGNELHKTSDTGIPNHERIVLYYDERYFGQFSKEEAELLLSPFRGPRRVLRLAPSDRLHIEQLLFGLLREAQERAPGYELPIRHAAAEALLFAARYALSTEAEPTESSSSPAAAKAMEIARYITDHFRDPLTLGELSRRFHLSPSYLSRTFKRFTGFGLTEYIGITRIKEAQRQLHEKDARIIDIAGEVGFESFSQFERVFKSHLGLSPRSYRSQHRQRR
ncbi:helix-turn-helix domain-containing protein [Paenibacillus solisilvae]|uniref:Helix-turn-helix domain-containing protein n=1 Tax=Paenibacillus solisilvae TaxID=2486751 RepID=A0ABW0VVG5_9BACL